MAKNNNLTDFLTDIADAIRSKTQTTETINPQDFSDKISSIQTGIDTSKGTITAGTVLKGYIGYSQDAEVIGAIETYNGETEDVVILTWYLNDDPTNGSIDVTINFTSNNTSYSRIVCVGEGSPTRRGLEYDSTVVAGADYIQESGSHWVDEAYRTITFETAPSSELLTWLETNGTPQ